MQDNSHFTRTAIKTVDAALRRARQLLGSRLEADLLASHALGRCRSWLYAHGSDQLEENSLALLEQLVDERLDGKPVAQILGFREFYGRDFVVNADVLIPRPETELLIDLALLLPLPEDASVCDVGTGSGCIAVTLAAERPSWQIWAIDNADNALKVARRNRDRLAPLGVTLLSGDLLEPIPEQDLDLIVSNPPYVAEVDAHLGRGDLRFEPRVALAAGADGLNIIRKLVEQAPQHLAPGGWLMLEHGHDQAAAVRQMLEAAGFEAISSVPDLADIERVTRGRKPS